MDFETGVNIIVATVLLGVILYELVLCFLQPGSHLEEAPDCQQLETPLAADDVSNETASREISGSSSANGDLPLIRPREPTPPPTTLNSRVNRKDR